MTTAQESDFMVRVGPGTPMGNLIREYWIPACLSSELVADGPPMRLLLLGEKLIGIARPHAAAQLKVEESQLRYSEGKFHAGDRSLGFIELARALAGATPHPLNTGAEGSFGASWPHGCASVQVR